MSPLCARRRSVGLSGLRSVVSSDPFHLDLLTPLPGPAQPGLDTVPNAARLLSTHHTVSMAVFGAITIYHAADLLCVAFTHL